MAQRNDQVFQLSLTEIAFTIAFILLLLLGYLVFREQTQRIAAEIALSRVQSAERATAALSAAKSALVSVLQGSGSANPDEVITKLVAAEDARSERSRLQKQVDDLDAKLSALTEVRSQIENAAGSARADITKEEIYSALVLQDQLRKAIEQERADEDAAKLPRPVLQASAAASSSSSQPMALSTSRPAPFANADLKAQRNREAVDRLKQLVVVNAELKKQLKARLDIELKTGQEAGTIQEVVAAARSYSDLAKAGVTVDFVKKENSDLRGQVAFLKNRLDARGGRDYPPCWADENGNVQFLFTVETKPDAMVVTQGWRPEREADARALPGIGEVLSGSPHSSSSFVSHIQGIFNWSKVHDPQCRHYVQLKSSIADAVQSDRARLLVENYFYKTEVRR